MTNGKSKLIKLFIGLIAPAIFANCGQNPASVADKDGKEVFATVQSTVVLGKVGALGKGSAINLTKLVLTAVSTSTPPDTVRDTATVSGNAQVTVLRTLTLAPLRTWVVNAKSLDAK